ncbi:Tim17-domain-containing protein [Aspergillus eucalypticola CBS 122712]|uniref:Tim17-domain-containing protein n=1 Tax=Aspergillus eucalypticola (strain CBS 122712 / IBT 29274) TaxID=1448314 RepID=A0A317UL91_ASPEC|nr:Tim17-domain-containing protein [Aspergillus eucalypticola CBS 122712]PWY62149.1 Tim17-domain-containing protein [Aspergillus eucalypticola CBS 122712]
MSNIWDSITGRKQSKGSEATASAPDATSFLADLPDPSQLHPLAGLNQDTLDYITLEDSALDQTPGSRSVLPSRGWSDDLCYGTGTTYLAGLTLGGAWGLAEGLKKTPVTAPPKIRLNGALNSITRRGPFLGNSAGVVAMVYNGFNSGLGYARGKHDAANSIVAGALSGMVFKSTRGLKPMVISGGIVAGIAGGWTQGYPVNANSRPFSHNCILALDSIPRPESIHLIRPRVSESPYDCMVYGLFTKDGVKEHQPCLMSPTPFCFVFSLY